jgi:hypothetical protein
LSAELAEWTDAAQKKMAALSPEKRFQPQAQIRCQLQENSSLENHLLAIHTDQSAKPEYMSRAPMRVKHHKIAAAPPIKLFSG